MNEELVKLYFKLEKQIPDTTNKKKEQIEEVRTKLYTKFRGATQNNLMEKERLDLFVNQNISPLLERDSTKTKLNEVSNGFIRETIQIIEDIIKADLVRAKEIRDNLNIKNIFREELTT